MTSEAAKVQIRHIQEHLASEGFEVSFAPASLEIPYDVVLLPVDGPEEQPEGYQIELSFLPTLEEDMENAALLQCFAALPVEPTEGVEAELSRLVTMLNAKLPLIGFGYLEGEGMVFFRHILLLAKGETSVGDRLVTESIYMIGYLLNTFGPLVASVATGEKSLEQAVSESQFGYLFSG